jgi:type VI secretion system secreted protein Hcp
MAKGDILLRIEGKSTGAITGESASAAFPGAIDVKEWSWGMAGPTALGGAGPASRIALQELRITKGVDRATTALMSVMRSNEPIKKAVLTVRKSGSSPPVDYLVVTIERGRITSFDIGTVAPDQSELVERLSISFEKIEVSYAAQSSLGAKAAASNFIADVS